MWQLDYAKASHFDLTGESCWRRGGKRSIASGFNPYLIVGHEPRFQIALRRKGEKAEREVRFAAARAPADKNGVWAKRHAGAMDKLAALSQSRLLYEPKCANRFQPSSAASHIRETSINWLSPLDEEGWRGLERDVAIFPCSSQVAYASSHGRRRTRPCGRLH
jgi:hypothetical protein